ncbi:MAG: FkbM family methyltransferase [Proteobacteria bacterium]|nr:FkbM family methyltransferase [Pseudomonadota bacterium]
MILRRLAEMSLGRIPRVRRLPEPYGRARLVVNGTVGGLKYLLKPARQWDPELLRVAEALVQKGNVVWDVGANVGLFAAAASVAAGQTGRVVAVEADFDAVAMLQKTQRWLSRAEAGGLAPVTVLPVAVSDHCGFIEFAIARRARAANSIVGMGSTQTGGTLETRTVPCVTLDALLQWFPPPDVLKIDVEGAESLVLAGASRLLADVRPRIYCEVSSNSAEHVTMLLKNARYRLWDGATFGVTERPALDLATFNTVALP